MFMLCLALASAIAITACGGSSSDGAPDLSDVATATLPAELPEPLVLRAGAPVGPSGSSTYTIQSGDTLSGIADRFGVSLEDLLAANPGIDPRALVAGDTIQLPETPAGTPPEEASPEPESPEETPIPAPTDTPVPAPTSTPSSLGQTYVVKSGDIPETIAAQFGITTEDLLAANPGLDPRELQVGQVLIIPAPSEPPAEAAPTG
jgi:LysM repeat protein